MKITLKKSLAVIMALLICVSALFGMNLSAFAADNTVSYVYDGSYVYNWGTRGATATFLSPNAEAFYAENNVALSELLALSGSATESSVPSSALYDKLHLLMSKNHVMTTYGGTKELYRYTDCEQSDTSQISLFYCGEKTESSWDGTRFDREHTWPNSISDSGSTTLSDSTKSRETDIIMLRPSNKSNNSSRGNKPYGESSGYINPFTYSFPTAKVNDSIDVRGDVARTILYVYVRYGEDEQYNDGALEKIWGANGVFESKEILLDWIEADPVDTWELGRNDSVEAITGTRNVFVDYPELAFDLFNEAVPTGYTTPSGGADVDGSAGGGTDDDTQNATTTEIVFNLGENGSASHSDGGSVTSYTETVGNYTLTLANLVKVYGNARDGKGNSALKLGTSGAAGSFSITVPDDVTSVTFKVAGYKATNAKISVNDTAYTISTLSNNGEYTAITVDTTTNKTVSFTTASGGYRCMIDSIAYGVAGSSSGDGGDSGEDGGDTPDIEEPTDPTPDPEEPDAPSGGETKEEIVTISFATDAQRVSQTGDAQIWSNDGLTFTNNKASSSNAVVSNVNPVRIYANSSVTLEHVAGKIKSITFAASGSTYVTPLQNSANTISGATVTTSGTNVTATFDTPIETCTIAKVTAQFRLTSVTATVVIEGSATGATITAQPNNSTYGTVKVIGKCITATPATGYEISGYEILSGDRDKVTVTQDGNKFTVETTVDVTIQINFVARQQYTVKFSENGNITSTLTAYSGDTVKLPALSGTDYTAVGWVTNTIDGETTEEQDVKSAGSVYTVTENITLYALYSRQEVGGSGESNTFTKWTKDVTEGDYIIVGANSASTATPYGAMNTSKNNGKNRLDYTEITVTNDTITTDDSAIIWHIASSGDGYWTIYNETAESYAAGNGTKNLAVLITSITNYAKWNITGTTSHIFENVGNKNAGVNSILRRNGTSGYACYAASTGTAPVLYKRTEAALTTYYFTGASAPEYTVTAQANNADWGAVIVSGTTISATAAEGYIVSGYTITSGTATVTQEGDTFFVTPTSNVEITINFEAIPIYTVTFVEGGNEVDTQSTYGGSFITLPAHTGELDQHTTFIGWAARENETDDTKIQKEGYQYPVKSDVTLYAQYIVEVVETASHNFVKLTEEIDDWSGTYLIVYEEGGKALNGAISDDIDVVNNNIDVQISDNKIAANAKNMSASFTIENTDDGYVFKTTSGFYIGQTKDDNGLKFNQTTQYINQIAIDADGNAVITSGGAYLRYNFASNQNRFRYYSSDKYSNQKAIALYKLEEVGKFTSAQVSMGADLGVEYGISITNIENVEEGSLKMRFTVDELSVTVLGAKNGDKYEFDFVGLSPQRMGDMIKAELLYHDVVVETKDNYSVKQNLVSLINTYPDNTKLKQLVSDMLYYGAAAQEYSGYNKTDLVTDGIEDLLLPQSQQSIADEHNKIELSAKPDGDIRFKSATVWFDVVNKLIIKVNNPNDDSIKLCVNVGGQKTWLEYDSAVGGYKTDEIKITDFDTVYTFELYDSNDNCLQTLNYSINTYAYSKQNSTNPAMAKLALALFSLGQSAENM